MIDLKEKLINRIKKTTNQDVLEEVYRLLEINFDDQSVYELNEEQKSAVHEAQEQIKKGDYLTNKDANNEIREWLKKK